MAEKGVYFTIGVEVLFSPAIQEIARSVPESLILTESDNPSGYRWLTGKIGLPSILPDVTMKLGELRSWSVSEIKERIAHNFRRLIGDDEWATRLNSLRHF
jgi:TatD DNase family protein